MFGVFQTGLSEMQWFLSPQGKMFRGKKAVLRHMKMEPNQFTAKEINIFKSVPLQVLVPPYPIIRWYEEGFSDLEKSHLGL